MIKSTLDEMAVKSALAAFDEAVNELMSELQSYRNDFHTAIAEEPGSLSSCSYWAICEQDFNDNLLKIKDARLKVKSSVLSQHEST